MTLKIEIFHLLLFIHLLGILSHTIFAQSCTTGDVICTPGQQYCAQDGQCTDLLFEPIVKTKGEPASNGENASHILIFSDVQYYYLVCKRAPLEECIYHNFNGPRPQRRFVLEQAAERQAQCVGKLSTELDDVKAVIHNGDITNGGTAEEVAKIDEFHTNLQNNLSSNQPLLIALGNHDYFLGGEVESVRVISYFEKALPIFAKRTALRNIDYNTTEVVYNAFTKRNEKYSRGSLCFSVEYNGYVFIILHWAVSQRSGEYSAKFESFDDQNVYHYIDVTPLTQWLVDEMNSAKKKERKVVLVPHAWKGLRRLTERIPSMMDFLQDSSLIAVLSGHVHDAYGLDKNWEIGTGDQTRTVPVYYAGSASYEKMISVELKEKKKGLVVQVYDTKTTPCVKTSKSSTQTD